MNNEDDKFPSYWTDEKDWLVEVVPLMDRDTDTLDWIGRVIAWTMMTNTRLLVQVGDPELPLYE